MPSPVTIPNPATMLSYQKAVAAGLVDKSYQKVMGKKIEVNADRIGWSPDLEWNQYARAEMIRGIGPKMQAALGMMTVGQFATTRGGMGFAALEPVIGKEGVSRLRNLQRALQACFNGVEEPVALKQVSAERFAELFAQDFNGHDVSGFDAMMMQEMIYLVANNTGAQKEVAIDVVGSAVAFELLCGALAAVEDGADPEMLGYQLRQMYHNVLGQFPDDVEAVGQKIESLMNQYAAYLPESVQSALGLDPSEPTPSPYSAEKFMARFGSNFNGRNVNEICIEDLMNDLESATDPAARKELLGDMVAFIGFGVMYGSIAAHEQGMPAVEIAQGVDQTLSGLAEVCDTAKEGEYVIAEMVKTVDTYRTYLPEIIQAAIGDIMPS